MFIPESELIINPDNSIYHLKLQPGDLAETIITVGDPDRIDLVTRHFDKILLSKQNREFKSVTGEFNGQDLSVVATGIGTDNIDIVFNEIDALFNVDFESRTEKEIKTALRFIRMGTSGTIRTDIDLDSIILSRYAIGLDGLLPFYKDSQSREADLEELFLKETGIQNAYAAQSSELLMQQFSSLGQAGITITATGFYGPQSRNIRLKRRYDIPELAKDIRYNDLICTNLEMETAGIYGLSRLLGHEAISINAILANRVNGAFSNQPGKTVEGLIEGALGLI